MAPARIPLEERFWPKVLKTDTCWLWQAQLNNNGYGCFGVWREDKGRYWPTYAHRLAWIFLRGPIPDGLNVLHHCDTPACVNPDHLWLGTQADNAADCWERGRHPPLPISMAKLSPEQVRAIRKDNRRVHVIASEYGVTRP